VTSIHNVDFHHLWYAIPIIAWCKWKRFRKRGFKNVKNLPMTDKQLPINQN